MSETINLLPVAAGPVWSAWEVLALVFITSAGAGMILASFFSLAKRKVLRSLVIASLASVFAGLVALTIGLEQPQRGREFLISPSSTSWTAIGAFILPAFLLCSLVIFFRAKRGCTPGKLLPIFAGVLGIAVLTYASMEIGACKGRQMWTAACLPILFASAGASGACGSALWVGAEERCGVLAGVMIPAMLVSMLTLFFLRPSLPLTGGLLWWRLPEILCLAACLSSLFCRVNPERFRLLAGGMGIATALLVFWKVILMGQGIPRLELSFSGGSVLAAALDWPGLFTLVGGLGLLGAAMIFLSLIWPPNLSN